MGFSLGGLIGGVMKGVGDGYSKYAEVEMDKKAKMDYAERILQLQEEKYKREAEFNQDLEVRGIGRKADATAAARVRNAPIEARAAVAGEVATVDAQAESGLPKKKADLAVAGEVATVDAQTNAGLPAKKAALTRATLEAERPNVDLKARIEGGAEGTRQTAKTSVPGFLDSLAKEDMAKSAGQRSVANITANAPKVTALADGTFAVTTGGKITSYLTDPTTGERVKGPKDLDTRTSAMVNALLLDAKSDLDPESRRATVQMAIDILQRGSNPTGPGKPSAAAIDALRRDPSKSAEFDAKFGAGASQQYLPAQNKK